MSEIRVNKVIDEAGTGAVDLTQGATLPAGKTITGAGSINLSGAVTATALRVLQLLQFKMLRFKAI